MMECKKCIMNSRITSIFSLDDKGICNYCNDFNTKKNNSCSTFSFEQQISLIKAKGKGKKYDGILGISGGRDSSYLAWWAKKAGLRVLLVHLDNGWNTEWAVHNIKAICQYTGFDLYTYVIDWEEFRELQKAYFKANVVDIEVLTDHAIFALLLKVANRYNIKYILHGNNEATESIMPKDWVYSKTDSINILDIVRKNSNVKIKTYPYVSFLENLYYFLVKKIEYVTPLNYIDYNVEEAKRVLMTEVGWVPYKFKHGESLFTRFYQNYILPKKFKIDKRYAHYSTLINSGQMTREEALNLLQEPLYQEYTLKEDMAIFLKKMNFSEKDFNDYLSAPPVPHSHYKTDKKWWDLYFSVLNGIKFKKFLSGKKLSLGFSHT